MRVAVIFFGLARGLDITLPSIRRTPIAPAATAGIRLELAASLNLVQRLDNPRTGEAGIALDPAEALLLGAQTTLLERQDDAAIAGLLTAAQAQPDLYANGWASIRNLLHQLASLRRAWPLCETMLERGCSHVLFLRPDLCYLDPIRLDVLAEGFGGSNSIALPAWHG